MEKKTYIAPEVVVEVLEIEALMLTASSTEIEPEDQRGTVRRGVWGNRWE